MKFKFEADLDYQNKAIDSTINILKGQTIKKDLLFSIPGNQLIDEGIGNNININNDQILINLNNIQRKNSLRISNNLSSLEFDIEMETGTGKTYVYLKTIFEMNKNYGFKKFIIIVPSIAIKEGVYKSLQMTKDHFKNIYNNTQYEFYIYKSNEINQIHSFSTNNYISIMIINIDSFNKKEINRIHQNNENLNGSKPINLLQETNPILIIDEPQSLSSEKANEAIKELNPSLVLRYSATHKKINNIIYKLDAIDAFNKKLVKKIEVLSITEKISQLKLISTNREKTGISAKIEIEYLSGASVRNKEIVVKKGDDLYKISNYISKYEGFIVDEINTSEDNEFVSFISNGFILTKNSHMGGVKFQDELKRLQIQFTIEEHLQKQVRLLKHNIKVLSLFFIDKVHNYREYYDDNSYTHGKYAKMFEEEFIRIASKKEFQVIYKGKDLELLSKKIHEGYFSKDKKGNIKDTRGNTKEDSSTYELIMKHKEKLLSFEEDLAFIFSHSALREGWDNPNVFQICTLNESKSTIKKRQEIGRGLRLCVNQNGERQYDDSINVLTIIANESYELFAKELQKDYQDEGIKFNIIKDNIFANIIDEKKREIGVEKSRRIFTILFNEGYINDEGIISKKYEEDQNLTNLNLDEFEVFKDYIISLLRENITRLPIQNANNKTKSKINKQIFLNKDFEIFWNKIKSKTTYAVDFDSENLKKNIIDKINKISKNSSNNISKTKAELMIGSKGVISKETNRELIKSQYLKYEYPDIVTNLQEITNLTRKTIVEILQSVNNFDNFKNNPYDYIQKISDIIKFEMKEQMVNGIKYTKINNDYYEQTLFENNEIIGYLEKNMIGTTKSIYNHIIYDSNVEKKWARNLELNNDVIFYTKLPKWFKIPTPLGSYNPDWAILLKDESKQTKLYFVVETKGSKNIDNLRVSEFQKIECGKKHFVALENEVKFEVQDEFETFIENAK
ncbi:MAG: DEAD/DEAH box helicase family protein [Metamycoplasmataceae bacterium]